MKVVFKIFWKLLQSALIILPLLLIFSDSYAQEKGFATIYLVATLVSVGALIGVAYYEDQWDDDPGVFWRTLRVIAIVAMVILMVISGFDKQRGAEDLYFSGAAVMLLAIALYFFFLQISFFNAGVYFTLLGVLTVAIVFLVPDLDRQTQDVFGAILSAFALLSFPLAWLVGKICDLFSGSSSSSGRVRRKEKKFSVSQVENACKACYNSKYSVNVRKTGSGIEVRLRGKAGYSVSGIEAASVRSTLESRLGVALSQTNIFVNY